MPLRHRQRAIASTLMAQQRNKSTSLDWIKLTLAMVLCLGAGALGSTVTTPAIGGWYATLVKPAFNPPNWIFGPVWTTLYILMGIAIYLIWMGNGTKKQRDIAQKLFYFQLGLNILWSFLFFGWHEPLWAFVEIVAMWVSIFLTIKAFVPISKPAAYLLFPYLAWVSFATILNLFVVLLNP